MRAQLEISTIGGGRILTLDVTAAPRGGLVPAITWAWERVRDAYLRSAGLLPGPVAMAVGRASTSEVLPGQYVCRGRVQLGVLALGDDCSWRREPASVRDLVAELRTAYA